MRHLGSLLLSLLSAALIYVFAGIGIIKATEIHSGGGTDWTATAITFGSLAAAGLIYTMLLFMRLSPVGLVAAGLALLGVALWSMFWPANFLDTMPADIGNIDNAGVVAAGPLTTILAIPLLAAIFSARRWNRYGDGQAALVEDAYPGSAVSTFPNYTPPISATPEYPVPTSAAPSYTEYSPPADPYAVYTPPPQPSYSEEPTEAGQASSSPTLPASQLPPDPSKPY